MLNTNAATLFKARGNNVRLNVFKINVRDFSVIAVKDLGDLLKGRTTGFYVEEANEEEFKEDPDLELAISYVVSREA